MSADTKLHETATDAIPAGTGSSDLLWNLPNALTVLRIFLVPLLVVMMLTRYELIGVTVFLTASFTDWLDGRLARKRSQVTTLGKLLDPLADKLLISAAFISLVELGLAPAWMVVVIIGRELAITGLRAVAAEKKVIIPASPLGKYKLTAQVIAVSLLILGPRFLGDYIVIGDIALWAVVILATASMVQYVTRFWSSVVASE